MHFADDNEEGTFLSRQSSALFYTDQVFMIYLDENSPEKDIVIRMFCGPNGQERFLYTDI